MTLVKTIGVWLLWGLRLGIVLASPLFFFLCCLLFMASSNYRGSVFPPYVLLSLLLLVVALYIGWRCDLSLPLQRPQIENTLLAQLALLFFSLSSLCLLANVGRVWIHSDTVDYSNTVGLKLHFVPEYIPPTLDRCVVLASALLFILMLASIAHNYRQLRLLVFLVTISFGFASAAQVVAFEMTRLKLPEWQVKRDIAGSDSHTYFFLQENPVFRGNNFTAVGRQTAWNPFFNTVEIIVLDKETRHQHGALLKGMKHDNAQVAQVCKKLLALDRHIER